MLKKHLDKFLISGVAALGFAVSLFLVLENAPAAVNPKNTKAKSGDGISIPRDSPEEIRERRRWILFDVFFLTPERGFAVGGDGLILSTTDGGKSWTKQKIGDQELHQITFVDSSVGWMLSEAGLLKTNDAGRTWTPRPLPHPRAASRLYFVSPQAGWLLGNDGLIFNTSDGGKTWRRQSSGTKQPLNDIACFSAASCIIAGDKNTLLTTSNGGRTWIRRSAPIANYYELTRLGLARDGSAWVLASAYKNGYLLRSNDRGRTWQIASNDRIFDHYPASLHFFDRERGVILDIAIVLIEDGGATWKLGWRGGAWLSSLFFFNDKLAWAVGDFRTILHTEDGGNSWVKQYEEEIHLPLKNSAE